MNENAGGASIVKSGKAASLIVQAKHIDVLHDHRIFTARSGKSTDSWMKIGKTILVHPKISCEPYSEFQVGQLFHSMGAFSFSRSSLGPGVNVGRYSVMANKVSLMEHEHPTDRLTFANIDYKTGHSCYTAAVEDSGREALSGAPWKNLPPPAVEIGHSTWIGSEVLLKRRLSIGIGSLVAARSVVTRDVPPFTMVAGIPAVPRGNFDGFRYPTELRERLVASRWWEYRFTDFQRLDTTDPARFLDGFEIAVKQGDLRPYQPKRINILELLKSVD